MTQKFLTVDDLMELLNVRRSWIFEHTRRGTADPLPHFRFGKYLRFKQGELEEWIEGHRKGNV